MNYLRKYWRADRIQWWAFGIPQSNIAFVNATRTVVDSGERCLLEITNLSTRARNTELVVESEDAATQEAFSLLHRSNLEIGPRGTNRIFLNLPPKTPLVRARIGDDALAIDNEVMLLPQRRKPVRVDVRIQDLRIRSLIENALGSTGRALLTKQRLNWCFLMTQRLPMIPPRRGICALSLNRTHRLISVPLSSI